jgi:hypothetical protein
VPVFVCRSGGSGGCHRESKPGTCRPPAGANEFAAGKAQSPPSWTRRPGHMRHLMRLRVRNRYAADAFACRSTQVPRLQSAKADFAIFQRRIHSLLGRTRRPGRVRRLMRRRVRNRYAGDTFACRSARVPRLQSANADFAIFQRGIHSLLGRTRRPCRVRRLMRLRVRNRYAVDVFACRSARVPRLQSAKADFAIFQRRIHSLLAGLGGPAVCVPLHRRLCDPGYPIGFPRSHRSRQQLHRVGKVHPM